ncbi:MAG: FtsX-like permease family protein [Gemmatimonas sp.]|nr:FtsX-like permease family protein [Gemmatimonas sp.]
MLTARLAVKSLRNRVLTTSLTVVSIALSVTLLVGIENVRVGMRESFSETISQTDLIVGARGGSIQLLLSTVFGIGSPSNSVSWETYEHFRDHPAVAWTIPYSLGDSHRGFRVIGTTDDFYERFRYRDARSVELAEGRRPANDAEVVLGSQVADELGYPVGDQIELTHGIGPMSFVDHQEHPFEVVGVLGATFTPVDRAVYVTLEGIEAIHEGWEEGAMPTPDFSGGALPGVPPGPTVASGQAGSGDLEVEAITSFFVGTRSRIDALRLQRDVNTFVGEPVMGILPGVALAEMWRSIGYAEDALKLVTAFVVLVGLLGMVVSLYTSLNERRREMAVLRAVGAKRGRIVSLLVLESGLLATLGCALGVALVYGLLLVAQGPVENAFGLYVPIRPLGVTELLYVGVVVLAGFLLGLIPALKAYRNALVDGLSLRV